MKSYNKLLIWKVERAERPVVKGQRPTSSEARFYAAFTESLSGVAAALSIVQRGIGR